jgi:hypothetical protein
MHRHRFFTPSLVLAVATSLLAVGPVRASLVLALDTATMVQRADHVAVVDVASVNAAWDEMHEHILTTIDLTVVESWKGPMTAASHIKVVQPGGTVGDLSMVVFGMTRFTPGERALVFLRGAPTAASVVGMAQGKRAVRRDEGTGRWMVHAPDHAGASFVRTTPATTSSPVFEMRARALDDLRTEVRGLVGKATGR